MNDLIKNNDLSASIEKVLVEGDLSLLTSEQRIHYYKSVCDSLGLNSLTKPFEYINLNGKLTLYATRACTEQLRKIYGVSIVKIDTKQVDSLYLVTAYAQDKSGKTDISTGALDLKGLSGEKLANALMKAETKAKRRVTLSICGLGLLDETEVSDILDAEPENSLTYDEKKSIVEQEEIKKLESFKERNKLDEAIENNTAFTYDLKNFSNLEKEEKKKLFDIIQNVGAVIKNKIVYSLVKINELEEKKQTNIILDFREK